MSQAYLHTTSLPDGSAPAISEKMRLPPSLRMSRRACSSARLSSQVMAARRGVPSASTGTNVSIWPAKPMPLTLAGSTPLSESSCLVLEVTARQ